MAMHDTRQPAPLLLGILRLVVALAFLMAGGAKLIGLPMMIDVFGHIGWGQWFRYVTGAIEIEAALLLLTHRFVGVGGLLLVATMAGAILAHLLAVPGSPIPAALLLVLSAAIAWMYQARTADLVPTLLDRKVPA